MCYGSYARVAHRDTPRAFAMTGNRAHAPQCFPFTCRLAWKSVVVAARARCCVPDDLPGDAPLSDTRNRML